MTSSSRRLVLVATLFTLAAARPSWADGPGMGHGGPGGPDAGPGAVLVAPDGKTLVTERIAASGSTAATYKLVAVSAAGTTAWAHTASSPFQVLVSGNLVILSSGPERDAASSGSSLVALDLGAGTQAWTLTVDGAIGELEAANGGAVMVVVKSATSSGTTTITRTLQFVNASGSVAWSVTLGT